MSPKFAERWERTSALLGTATWIMIDALAGMRHAPLGVIELFLLFAPLVIVPLGLALGRKVSSVKPQYLEDSTRLLQPFAAGLAVISFWLAPGMLAGILVVPWLVLCGALGLQGALTLLLKKTQSLSQLAFSVGRIDLTLAGGWLLISRLGLHLPGIQEPILLLTAVHFHYTGFGTACLAGTLAAYVRQNERAGRFLRPWPRL
jgi:YndJ-like protein